jgi:hypothetical protein
MRNIQTEGQVRRGQVEELSRFTRRARSIVEMLKALFL